MPLNPSKGNMYEFITHTWNTVKGACPHLCTYCYMHRWGKQKPVRFDEKELKTNLGHDNFIFVGSSCDMWAETIPEEWIKKTLKHMEQFNNKYLIQTKNPDRILDFIDVCVISDKCVVCTTIETNRVYKSVMANCPTPKDRAFAMNELAQSGIKTYVTIEPIMDFDLDEMVYLIETCLPTQVNIGADSARHNLPEPHHGKVTELIQELQKFTTIHNKSNLKRLQSK